MRQGVTVRGDGTTLPCRGLVGHCAGDTALDDTALDAVNGHPAVAESLRHRHLGDPVTTPRDT